MAVTESQLKKMLAKVMAVPSPTCWPPSAESVQPQRGSGGGERGPARGLAGEGRNGACVSCSLGAAPGGVGSPFLSPS